MSEVLMEIFKGYPEMFVLMVSVFVIVFHKQLGKGIVSLFAVLVAILRKKHLPQKQNDPLPSLDEESRTRMDIPVKYPDAIPRSSAFPGITEMFIQTMKVVFVFKEELFIPTVKESEFLDGMMADIKIHSGRIIVFDMTYTRSMNEVVLRDFKLLIDALSHDGYRLTVVLPNIGAEDALFESKCRELYSYVANAADRTQNYHIKVKYDTYGNNFPGFEEIYLHHFFDSVDKFLYHKIPHVDIDDPQIKKTVVALLSAYFSVYKHMMIRYMSLCKDHQSSFTYDEYIKAVRRIFEIARKTAIRYGVPEETASLFTQRIKDNAIEQSDGHRRIFDNPWRTSVNELINTTLDVATLLLSRAFDFTYELSRDGKIRPSTLPHGTEVDLSKMRIEVSTDAFTDEI